jgi:hypothetical protein
MAWLVEAFVEYFVGKLADQFPALGAYKWTLPYVAAAVAVPLAFYYQIDLISLITTALPTWVGIVLTGLLISRGAGFVNDFLSFLGGKMTLPKET